MSALQDIIREEYSRLIELKKRYVQELATLPKGTISKKKIRNHNYYYLAYRRKDKVKFDYLGKEDAPKLKETRAHLKRRTELEQKLKQVIGSIKEISKSIGE
jgi:hypothetical protein